MQPTFRKVFFSFHYQRDIWRASQVRNSWVTQGGQLEAGWVDRANWESITKGRLRDQVLGQKADDRHICTVVPIGFETWSREYVRFEIEETRHNGKGLWPEPI